MRRELLRTEQPKVTPDFFIGLFSKMFGKNANLVMCLLAFAVTEQGKIVRDELKVLLSKVKAAIDSEEGEKLIEEIKKALGD